MAQIPQNNSDLIEFVARLVKEVASEIFPSCKCVDVNPSPYRHELVVSFVVANGAGDFTNCQFGLNTAHLQSLRTIQLVGHHIIREVQHIHQKMNNPRLGDPFREAVRRALKTPSQIDQKVLEDSSRISERMFLSDFRNWWDTAAVHVPFTSKVTPFIPNGA